jgi:lysophospholipase L1-like esterase
MNNIVTFGDSFTHGWGLPDQDKFNSCESKFSWPCVLSSKLNMQYKNMAVPGASNREIWHRLLNYNFTPDDIVIILWTWVNRYAIITGPNQDDIEQIKINTPIARRLDDALNTNNDFDRKYDSMVYIDHANRVLKDKNVVAFNFYVDALGEFPMWAGPVNSYNADLLSVWKKFPYTSDFTHPSVDAYKETATIMYDFIRHKLK